MIRKAYIILLFVLWCCAYVQAQGGANGYTKLYHPNGIVSSEGLMVNGQPEGVWKNYNEDGQLVSEGSRKNHQLDGVWKFYSDSGRIQMEVSVAS